MYDINIVVVGSGGVGKSALIAMFVSGIFIDVYDPTIEDCYRKHSEIDGIQYMMEIIDTAGTEQFTAMRDLYTKAADGFAIVYSIISASSFADVQKMYDQVMRVKESKSTPMILVGNKCDLEGQRAVTAEQAALKAKELSCPCVETSARRGANVAGIFNDLAKQIYAKKFQSGKISGKKTKQKAKCIIL